MNTRRKNAHGRTGKRRALRTPPMRAGRPASVPQIDRTRPEYRIGYDEGRTDGAAAAAGFHRAFLATLATKKNIKDVRGLIDRYLAGEG